MRKEDKLEKKFARSNRLYQKSAGWFFTVRQGAEFGPYDSQCNAEKSLRNFISFLI